MFEGEESEVIDQGMATKVLLVSCTILAILFGLMPDLIVGLLA
jgi:hypothetical protein